MFEQQWHVITLKYSSIREIRQLFFNNSNPKGAQLFLLIFIIRMPIKEANSLKYFSALRQRQRWQL